MAALIARLDAALSAGLARKAAVALIAGYAATLLLWVLTAPGGVRPDGSPLGADFSLFHAAGRLALHGRLADAYDQAAITAVERAAAPGLRLVYLWRYPPPLALLLAPLGALPYFAALAVWSAAGIALFGHAMSRLVGGRDGWLLALGAPAAFTCLMGGQTAFLTAGALALGLTWLDRRPWLAGVALSLLICKPHFAPLAPLALLAGRRGRAFGGFAAGAAVLCALSLAAFGWAPWAAFLTAGSGMGRFLQEGGVSWGKAPTAFVLALSLHAPSAVAWGLQLAVSAAATGFALLAWARPRAGAPAGAVLACARLLVSPYVIDYDYTVLTVACAGLIAAGATTRPGVKAALLLGLATPTLAPAVFTFTGLQLGVLPVLGLFALLARAYWSEISEAGSETASCGPDRFTARWVG